MTVLSEVTAVVAAQLERDPAQFSAGTDLEDEGFTSLDLIEVVFALEEKFDIGIKLNANDPEAKQRTVGDLANLVERLVSQHATK